MRQITQTQADQILTQIDNSMPFFGMVEQSPGGNGSGCDQKQPFTDQTATQ